MSSSRHILARALSAACKWAVILPVLLLFFAAIPNSEAKGAAPQTQTYTISGLVTDGFNNPIAGATVTLSGAQTGTTTTDANGSYSFQGLAAGGNYNLTPSKAGQYTSFTVSVNNLSGNQTVNLRLSPYVSLHIHVVDEAGNGLSGVTIKIGDFGIGFAQTNANGDLNLSISIAATGNSNPPITLTPQKAGYIFDPPNVVIYSQSGNQILNFKGIRSNAPVASIQFSAPAYAVGEGDGSALITVTRTGDTNSAVSVNYFTGDAGVATQRSDYTMAAGTLDFAPGETSKTFRVLITDNALVQGPHTLFLQLINPTGGAVIGSPSFVTLAILDNDFAQPTSNPLDDSQFFVRQHYYDFLNRLPDAGGLDYWTNELTKCGSDQDCLRQRRIGISAAFFITDEFRETGYVVYRINRAALGLVPNYAHFMVDRSSLVGGPQLQQSTRAFAERFVASGAFRQLYPDTLTPTEFVNKLFDTADLKPFTQERAQLVQEMLNGKTRAEVLLDVIEIPAFKEREYNPAFVLMQYYGYLRRDPEPGGYAFWLDVLNNKDPSNFRGMVCSFITSAEYQQRFSTVATHSNNECR